MKKPASYKRNEMMSRSGDFWLIVGIALIIVLLTFVITLST